MTNPEYDPKSEHCRTVELAEYNTYEISILCVRPTLKHTHNKDYVSLRGHCSVAGEQLMWQTIQQMERGGERDGGRE